MEEIFGVIGDPIGHSMSPLIHNDAFKHHHIKGVYLPFQVKQEHLKEAVEGIKALGIKGLNVTIPHKVSIMPMLDEIDESARLIGAVNTVQNRDGKLIGYNTDGVGFYKSIKPFVQKEHSEAQVLLIGAGGAARAILTTLAKEGFVNIDLVNRTKERAQQLKELCPFQINGKIYSLEEFRHTVKIYDLIVQTTSIGMSPHVHAKPLELSGLIHEQTVVTDIIYNPLQTAFLKEAKKLGAKTVDGVGMFVHQAAQAFQLWTGIEPNVQRMKNIVYEKLRGAS
ncbi:shikimate dehydrogenase [Aeribacillus alveayuensis]|uniref:Shikimate dehydrogenase (NADP(+)) n=1 Tax=Aeribacillus alveayuensis TaxID=279215 RepID=A0ABT9VK66_9BACI|nr:shikimate dehydrogenase [Bacillus alveayuensis]